MPFAIPALLSGISGLAGGLNNRPNTSTQTNTGTINDTGSGTQTTTPTFTPKQQQLSDQLVSGYESSLNEDPNLSGYQAQGQAQINAGSDAREKAVKNILASRGLSFSPNAGAVLGQAKNAGITQGVDFANSIPMLAQQLKLQKLQQAGGFFNSMAHGQTGSFTTNNTRKLDTTTKTTNPGNILGGAVSGIGSMLAYLYGNGAFGKGGNNNGSGAKLNPGLFGGGNGGGFNFPGIPSSNGDPGIQMPGVDQTNLGDLFGGMGGGDNSSSSVGDLFGLGGGESSTDLGGLFSGFGLGMP